MPLLTSVHSEEGHEGREAVYCESRRFECLQVKTTTGYIFGRNPSFKGHGGDPEGAHQDEAKDTHGPGKSESLMSETISQNAGGGIPDSWNEFTSDNWEDGTT